MIPELRKEFNARWAPPAYAGMLARLDEISGAHVGFRVAETPIFLPRPLLDKMVRYGQELYAQLAANPAYREASLATVPVAYRAPQPTEHPLFLQADFGIVQEEDERFEPKLVEIQGFPSIYGFQVAMAHEYERAYRMPEWGGHLTTYLSGLDEAGYRRTLGDAILGGHAPEQVALLEIDPHAQKTLPDFLITQKLFGLEIADVRDIRKRGRKLYLGDVEIKRLYNRVIVDELLRKNVQPEFQFSDDVDVEWAGHPDWFFRISKFSLPWLHHVSVPETCFLSDYRELPDRLNDYVLKPLYSFAGLGVTIGPTREQLTAIPADKRAEYVLQRKVDFVPTVDTPDGPTKVEVRVMYIWNGSLQPVTTLLRLGRGKMMGVDFNRELDWVGASAGFVTPEP